MSIDFLTYLPSLLVGYFTHAMFVLGLFLAANHKFYEGGEEKTLILVPFKEWLDRLFIKMDNMRILVGAKNWVAALAALCFVVYPFVKFLQTGDSNYFAVLSGVVVALAYQKSFQDLGVMFLGCYRCMPTAWAAIPLMVSGLFLGITVNTIYFLLMPFGIFSTAVISSIVSFVYQFYDKCKLDIQEMKLERELSTLDMDTHNPLIKLDVSDVPIRIPDDGHTDNIIKLALEDSLSETE